MTAMFEYSQSYNRYSYCFNNPLRFTDPSGYVVRGRNDVLNLQYFIWLKSSNSKNGNSFNTDIVEGSPMMMEDNYTVDEQGYIKLVEKTNRGHNHSHPMNAYPSNNDKKWAQNVTSKFPTATLKIYLNGIYYEYDKFGMSESSIFKYYINY